MKIPQLEPDWNYGLYIGNGTIAEKKENKMTTYKITKKDIEIACKVLEKEIDRLLDKDEKLGDERLRTEIELSLLKARKFLKLRGDI
jgi:hypothetical protein